MRSYILIIFEDISKICIGLFITGFFFFYFGPTPDLSDQKEVIQHIMKDQLPGLFKENVQYVFIDKEKRDERLFYNTLLDYLALFFFWTKQIPYGLGWPFKAFQEDNIFSILFSSFIMTLILTFFGSIFALLFSLCASIWKINIDWKLPLNVNNKVHFFHNEVSINNISQYLYYILIQLSNLPAIFYGSFFFVFLKSLNLFGNNLITIIGCAIIIGYSDCMFSILTDYFLFELKQQYKRPYLPLYAIRGCNNYRPLKHSISIKALNN